MTYLLLTIIALLIVVICRLAWVIEQKDKHALRSSVDPDEFAWRLQETLACARYRKDVAALDHLHIELQRGLVKAKALRHEARRPGRATQQTSRQLL